jgi:riboflavin kinase/FMN adenylyltransferase
MIEEGRIGAANNILGYPYFIQGNVVEGIKLGRKLGYPTANVQLSEPKKLLPRNGVYAVMAKIDESVHKGMLSIGIRPTIDLPERNRTVEVNLFDFDGDLYGKHIRISFLEWLRCEKRFDSLQELKEQIATDKEEIISLFKTFSSNSEFNIIKQKII